MTERNHDLTSERETLYHMITAGELLDLHPEDFALPAHVYIWQTLVKMVANKRAITQDNVLKSMNKEPDARKALVDLLMADYPTSMNVQIRLNSLREYRSKRELKKLIISIEDKLSEGILHPHSIAEEIIEKSKEIAKLNKGDLSLTDEIRSYIASQTDTFTTQDCHKSISHRHNSMPNCRKLLNRMKKEGLVIPTGNRAGEYRIKNRDLPMIDWENADSDEFPFLFPIGLGSHFRLMPRNIMTVAGESDAGKTALALNVASMNVPKYSGNIHYFSSEMGEIELRSRLEQWELIDEDPTPLKVWRGVNFYDRVVDFQDVIVPDGINIIDYLHMREDFWKIGKHLDEIYEKLTTGVALVLIQKKKGADYGYGAELTIQKARLVINLENGYPHHSAKLVKVKNWRNPQHNPNGLEIQYNLVRGCQFITKGGWTRPDTEKESPNEQSNYRRGARSRPRTELHTERNGKGNAFDSHFGKVD